MPKDNFNLDTYETVEQRIARFYSDHADGRIITDDVSTEADRAKSVWRVKATIFFDAEQQARNLPKATGYAFEVDGRGMTQAANALETCETSAIGRALANGGYSGSKRPTREEMGKAQRQGPTREAIAAATAPPPPPASPQEIAAEVAAIQQAITGGVIKTVDDGRIAWAKVKRMGADQPTLDALAQQFVALGDPAKA